MEIVELVENNMLDYASAVNQSRAIPDARTGLKPIHRKILYEMYADKIKSDGKFKKCAYMVGQIIARFSEHGDAATYDALVRMSQPWIQRYPLLDFHGNNGSQFGDSAASMRYTESKLTKLAEEGMLHALKKKNVDWIPNFTQEEEEPVTLPAIFPGLFCMPNQGMGYAAACHFVTYNLQEVANYLKAYMTNENLPLIYPDFASGGVLVNPQIASQVQATGKGTFIVDSKYTIKNNEIVISEIPFNVMLDDIVEQIIELCKQEELLFVEDLHCDGMELTIEVSPDADINEAVEILFNKTKLRNKYPVNQTALVDNKIKLLSFADMAQIYVQHNTKCIKREFQYDYEEAAARLHILEGLQRALFHIDEIIALIKQSKNAKDAKVQLIEKYSFDEVQTKAILDMKLSKLSNLEQEEIEKELREKQELTKHCLEIVESNDKQKEILIERLDSLVKKFGDDRRTTIQQKEIVKPATTKREKEKVIEDVVITFNPLGYLQNISPAQYKKNNFEAFKMTTEDIILLFSNKGKYYRVSPRDIKKCGSKDKGTAIGSIIKLGQNEQIIAVFSTIINERKPYILFVTDTGMIKKSEKINYVDSMRRNTNGLKGYNLKDNETIISIQETNGNDICLRTKQGYQIRFNSSEVRATGKTAGGVKGITLADGDVVTQCVLCEVGQYPKIIAQKRGGKGKIYEDVSV